MITTLLGTENSKAGYRLQYLEVFNWGTFDAGKEGTVWRVNPNAQNSLLTGRNGTGKTTLVHTLLALLVKNYNNYFNQSESHEKRERDEKTYFHGSFGKLKNENEQVIKQEIRPGKDHYSILLAYFSNQEKNGVTLAQVRYYNNSQLNKEFIFSNSALTITEHFKNIDTKGLWKKHLKATQKVEFFDSFDKYYNRFAIEFGLKDKAMNLFAKTIGVKVLGNLNQFIRENMLEETGAEEEYLKLRDSYETLTKMYNDIEKAEKQLDLLLPIIEKSKLFENLLLNYNRTKELHEIIPFYFATQKLEFLEIAEQQKIEDKTRNLEKVTNAENDIELLNQKLTALEIAKGNNVATQQLKDLKKEIDGLITKKGIAKGKADDYNKLARLFGFQSDLNTEDEHVFIQSLRDAQNLKNEKEETKTQLIKDESKKEELKKSKDVEFDEKSIELQYLEQNKTRIIRGPAKIRDEIMDFLGLTNKEELPFVAELIKIKNSEKIWESSLERLLHNFGLRLLVPGKYYSMVNQYVKDNNLKGLLVYHNVVENTQLSNFLPRDNKAVINKIELKNNSDFCEWVEMFIILHYNHICTTDDLEFQRCKRAITETGLIKDDTRHEKDDRPKSIDERNFILGWENKETIKAIRDELRELDKVIKQLDKDIPKLREKQELLKKEIDNLIKFTNNSSFDSINWKPYIKSISDAEEQRKRLLESSQQLQELENQIKQLKDTEIAEKLKEQKLLIQDGTNIVRDLKEYTEQKSLCKDVILKYSNTDLSDFSNLISPFIQNYTFSLTNIDSNSNLLLQQIAKLEKEEQLKLNSTKDEIVFHMQEFKSPSDDDLHNRFPGWRTETLDFLANIEHRTKFILFFDEISDHNLPAYKKRFKNKLDKDVINDITKFKFFLEKKEKEIKDKIDEELNPSLHEIDYESNPETYIKLEWNDKSLDNKQITDFKNDLKEIMSFYAQERLEKSYKNTFDKIKSLIQTLSENDQTRKRIIDVRNWLTFVANERYRADNTSKRYYDDSGGLSDGQKVKLTYTILASALSNQFNIHLKAVQNKSFRFIVIDEVFKGVDNQNADYTMQLFDKLQLQVMIVTPLDKINIVEDYIHSVHYVENENGRNSKVYNLTMTEYEAKKKAFIQIEES